MTRYRALESWRGVAAVLVFVYHNDFAGPLSSQGLGRGGYLWVDFFFVLSGFVIAHAYGERIGSLRDAAVFLVRRFGRLWPLHFAMLLVLLAASALAHYAAVQPSANGADLPSFVANLFLLNAMGLTGSLSWNGPSWSIGAEFWTYLAFCLAVMSWRGAMRLAVFLVVAASAAVGLELVSPHDPIINTTYDFGFVRALYGFFVGAAVQALPRSSAGLIGGRWRATALEAAATFCAIAFVISYAHGPLSIAAPLVFAPVLLVFSHDAGAISSLLGARILVALGTWSYSIYMVSSFINNGWARVVKAMVARLHGPALFEVAGAEPLIMSSNSAALYWLLQAGEAALLVALVALAAVSFRFVEQPARAAFNALADRLAKPASERPLVRMLAAVRR